VVILFSNIGEVTTVCAKDLDRPTGVAISKNGEFLFVVDASHTVKVLVLKLGGK